MKGYHLPDNSPQGNHDYGHRSAELEALSAELAEKTLELATLEKALSIFEEKYARTLGLLIVELDEIEKEIAAELYRLNPEEVYEQGFQRAKEKAKSSQDTVNEKIHQSKQEPTAPSEELKDLFRKVAKTVHPDLATEDDERVFRNTLMTEAIEAYKNGDMEALERILDEWERGDERSIPEVEVSSQLDQLDQRILQMKRRIKEIERRVAELKESDLYQLMLRVDRAELEGRDLLGDMADDLQNQIRAAKELLLDLRQRKN